VEDVQLDWYFSYGLTPPTSYYTTQKLKLFSASFRKKIQPLSARNAIPKNGFRYSQRNEFGVSMPFNHEDAPRRPVFLLQKRE